MIAMIIKERATIANNVAAGPGHELELGAAAAASESRQRDRVCFQPGTVGTIGLRRV